MVRGVDSYYPSLLLSVELTGFFTSFCAFSSFNPAGNFCRILTPLSQFWHCEELLFVYTRPEPVFFHPWPSVISGAFVRRRD